MSFWDKAIVPTEADLPRADGSAYREMRRKVSASRIYDPAPTSEQRAAVRPSIYEPREYGGIESYMGNARDSLAQKQGESFEAYERRLNSISRALPDGEVERRLAEAKKLASEESWSWEAHRAETDTRTTGASNGSGLLELSPGQRAAALDASRAGDSRTPASMSQVRAAIEANEQAQRGQPVRHTDVSNLASTGEGWITR